MWHFTAEERGTNCWIVVLSGYITYWERWGCWLSTSCGRRGGSCSYWSETNGRITPGVDFTSLQFILPPPLPNPPHSLVSDISVLCYCYFAFCIVYTFHVSCTVVQAAFANYKQSCFIYYVPPPNNSFTFFSEDGGTIFPRNAGNNVSDRMLVKTGRSQSESLLSWKPEILQNFYRRFTAAGLNLGTDFRGSVNLDGKRSQFYFH